MTLSLNNRGWMQAIYNDIKHLKLHELTLPSSHNAGMDRASLGPIGGNWAVTQDYTFRHQLNFGARVLDLRIADYSDIEVGGPSRLPTNKFKEDIRLEHVLPGRKLSDCVSAVRTFAETNRGEIIILDVHSYSPGRNLRNALGRCKAQLNKLSHLLLPSTASNMTLEQIRQNYPGRNVIICWTQGGYWTSIKHQWIGKNLASPNELIQYIKRARHQRPQRVLSSLSATAYSAMGGPMRLKKGDAVWTEVFRPGQPLFNIINVDFIQDTGVIQSCIQLNKARKPA